MTGTDQFREKLDELVRLAQRNGQRLMKAQVEEALRESGLDRKKMGLVFDYLDQMGIEVLDPDSASGDAGGRAGSISLAAYLRELEGIAPLPEEAEQSLFDEAVLGDREARNVLAERYLNTVCDLAGEFDLTGKAAIIFCRSCMKCLAFRAGNGVSYDVGIMAQVELIRCGIVLAHDDFSL
jgi:hypothetical protein